MRPTIKQLQTWGAEDGIADVQNVLVEQGRGAVVATLSAGHLGWDEAAINAGAHWGRPLGRGWSLDAREVYYASYASAARQEAERIAAEVQP